MRQDAISGFIVSREGASHPSPPPSPTLPRARAPDTQDPPLPHRGACPSMSPNLVPVPCGRPGAMDRGFGPRCPFGSTLESLWVLGLPPASQSPIVPPQPVLLEAVALTTPSQLRVPTSQVRATRT